jgi:nitrate reductase gamma subunit
LLFGFSPGLLSALVGIAGGIVVGLLAIMTNAPKYVLIALTSIGGAVATVGGILLLFNKIPFDTYSYTTANVTISNSFLWTVVTIGLIVVGIAAQAATARDYEFDEWTMGDQAHHLPPTTTTHPTGVS